MPPAPPDGSGRYAIATDLFLRGLALVYLVAFASFWWQLPGLVGPQGILPAQGYLDALAAHLGAARWWQAPTLCWFFGAGTFLHVLCAAGVLLALAAFLRLAQAPCLALLWLAYLSLATPGQIFLSFQWDTLLLETGLLAIFLAPWRLVGRTRADPPRAARWLLWWLLFRLMFMSGLVKLTSGDDSWRDLTALTYHYETQPLPTWIGWWVHQLPAWFHRFSCAVMFLIELVGPFLLFGPRRLRHAAALAQVALQVLIAATGNYTFFNLLTVLLCILFLDDAWWPRRLAGTADPAAGSAPAPRFLPRLAQAVLFPVLLVASLIITLPSLLPPRPWPESYSAAFRVIAATRSVNSYGLFRVMTKTRPELVIEGSDDGREWRPYAFKWKPGDPGRRPGFVAPHQPRLDWQLWFAALAHPRREQWVLQLCEHLLHGTPAVTRLFAQNPFPDRPPRHVRVVVYDYKFTTPAERRQTGKWWRRDPEDFYFRPMSLKGP